MRKVINGKKYDTNTAKWIGWYSHLPASDFRHVSETLYRKRTGEFFLHGSGGPMTDYRKRCQDGSWIGDDKIVPMTHDEAKEWAKEHLDLDVYWENF